MTYTVILHIYYPGSWQLIKEKCKDVFESASQIIITGCYREVLNEVDAEGVVLLKVPNVGKDIGGKLAALNYYLQLGRRTDFLVLLHDKISPQSINADYWLQELFSIFKKGSFMNILERFKKDKSLGVVGSKSFLKNEFIRSSKTFDTSNSDLLIKLLHQYKLYCKTFDYVAGTIFIVRSTIYESFFSVNPPLEIRKNLERGNVLDLANGSVTHCWERLFCFIADHYQYKVEGY